MKLPIKKEYFDKIKSGEKRFDYRDAHITFVCEETGETLRKEVVRAEVMRNDLFNIQSILEEDYIIKFELL